MPITAEVLKQFLLPSKVFVETGSAGGAGIQAALDAGFEEIYSADISGMSVLVCRRRFVGDERVEVHKSDAVLFLMELVPALVNPCVFWLDAHSNINSLILEELKTLIDAPCRTHTLLIDDRRLMQGHWRSAKEEEVHEAIHRINPQYAITYADGYTPDDIIVARVP